MSKNKKILLAVLTIVFIATTWAGIKFSNQNQSRRLIEEATSSYDRGAYSDAWAKVEPSSKELIHEENGCELLISSAINTQRLKEAEQLARDCLMINRGVEISGEAIAMILSKEGKQQEAALLLNGAEETRENWRLSSALSRLYSDLGNTEEARQKMLRALTVAKPWDQAFQRALSSKLMDDQKFIEESTAIVLTKTEKFPELERKLLVKLWTFKLSELANKLLERLGSEAVPPLDENKQATVSDEVKKTLSEPRK